jgi:acetyltransferase-like isoleucine patch superfamily enzyme
MAAMDLSQSDRAPGLLLGDGVEIPADVTLGGHVVIHASTQVGSGVTIQDGAIVGKPVRLGPKSTASTDGSEPAVLGERSAVLAGAVIFAGAVLGEGAIAGDQCQVRERATVGAGSVIGRGSAVDNDVTIGSGVRVQSNCYITAFSTIEDEVFVGPGVVTTNDNAMGRHERGAQLHGALLRRACRIGGGAVICPGVEVGEEAFVAAGAIVTRDVPARAVMIGAPARHVRDVGDEDLLEAWRPGG